MATACNLQAARVLLCALSLACVLLVRPEVVSGLSFSGPRLFNSCVPGPVDLFAAQGTVQTLDCFGASLAVRADVIFPGFPAFTGPFTEVGAMHVEVSLDGALIFQKTEALFDPRPLGIGDAFVFSIPLDSECCRLRNAPLSIRFDLLGHAPDFTVPATGEAVDGYQWDLFVSQPAPEPATLLLFGMSAGGLALFRWRRRERAHAA
jgi:PEP-CTERM motif